MRKTSEREAFAGLLECIAIQVGCQYLSDLHRASLTSICHALAAITPSLYSLREWEDAVCYIIRTMVHFETQEQAREYLLGIEQTDKSVEVVD